MDNTNIDPNITNINPQPLQDPKNILEIKNLIGSILLGSGILMGIVLFAYGLLHSDKQFDGSFSVMQLFIYSGISLLLGSHFIEKINVFGKK